MLTLTLILIFAFFSVEAISIDFVAFSALAGLDFSLFALLLPLPPALPLPLPLPFPPELPFPLPPFAAKALSETGGKK